MTAGVLEEVREADPAGNPEAEMQELFALSSDIYDLASYSCFVTICTIRLVCCE